MLSGGTVDVQGQAEHDFYLEAQKKYMSEFSFTAASDLRALDRLIFSETMLFRWQGWLASGYTYDGPVSVVTETQIRRSIKETSAQVSQIQQELALTLSQRQRDQYESVGGYILKLKAAAKEFGIHRETQLTTALDLFNKVMSTCGTWLRSNENERRRLGFEDAEAILAWIDTTVRNEYEVVDKEFQKKQIKYVRDL